MYIAQINSTNDYLKNHPDTDQVYTDYQTAGRGQMGNGWESEPGKNVLVSVRLNHHQLSAHDQWQICEMASVALWQTVAPYVPKAEQLTIKWPNDLYYGDRKLAGMLIEHTLCGTFVKDSIIGIGLNVNQTQWTGNAPNPISIKQISGQENNIPLLVDQLATNLRNQGASSRDWQTIYRNHLYRKQGYWWWEEREVSTKPTMDGHKTALSFQAQIKDITPQGELVLETQDNKEKKYHFKQIKYILSI